MDSGNFAARGIHQSKVVRAGDIEALVHHLTADFIQHFARIFADFRQSVVQCSECTFVRGKLHVAVGKGREVSVYLIDQKIAQSAAGFGIKFEVHIALSADASRGRSNSSL